jgi:gamma-glutamylcyclotransferase (GGCT)/AIG2-like uncharacterized protein YtfP
MDSEQMNKRGVTFSNRFHGELVGHRLVFNKIPYNKPVGIGYANIAPDATSVVEGIIYEVNELDFAKLDKYEGGYRRDKIKIKTNKGMIFCFVYISDKVANGLKPEKTYIDRLLQGKDFLTDAYYAKLKSTETFD